MSIGEKVMVYLREAVRKSGQTYSQIGVSMGYPEKNATQAVSQFLKTTNPSFHRVLLIMQALDLKWKDLFSAIERE